MGITRINTNISSITAQRNVNKVGTSISRSIERLSSGLRINRAGDDAAGLSVANRLKTQVQGLDVAVTNAEGGINTISVAEAALDETTNRLNRIRQLALQAANTGVYDTAARNAIQDEIFQNIDEITRIASTTQFASNYLLNGDFSIQSELKEGQQNYGVNIDSSPVASTLGNGTSFLNIRQTQIGSARIVADDGIGNVQTMSTGIQNQTDIAVTMALFSDEALFRGANSAVTLDQSFFNGVSIAAADTFVYEGVLADGITKFTGTFSVSTAASAPDGVDDFARYIQTAIDDAEKALFGVSTTNSVPTAYRTKVAMGSGDNKGRIELRSNGEYINQSNISISLLRTGFVVAQADGVTRSGTIGTSSTLSGVGRIGNSVSAITGSTFASGNFEITVSDVQDAQQRKLENSIVFRDTNGAIFTRTTSIGGTATAAGTNSLVINGNFVNGIYTGGTTLQNGDLVVLTGTNADGTTFEGTFTFNQNAAATSYDTALNDFMFGSISGLVSEMNYRSRDYTVDSEDGTQTRFDDAIFTFAAGGTLQLFDDIGRSNSQTNFTLTFQRAPGTIARDNYTIQDNATLVQEGYAEQATFSINGGAEVRAEAGDVITLSGPESTKVGVPQEMVTFRVGSDLTAGTDTLLSRANEFVGALNGGETVTFGAGQQDVVFIAGGTTEGPAKYVTVDFDSVLDVTSDGTAEDNGITILISTENAGLNFQIGANRGQNIQFALGDLKADNLGFGRGSGRTVADVNVSTLEGANECLSIIDEALTQVNKTRSILGSATTRLESTVNSLSVVSENLTASESRIRDADIAKETSDYTKNQVLLQAGVSVLTQANFQSQGFLALLG